MIGYLKILNLIFINIQQSVFYCLQCGFDGVGWGRGLILIKSGKIIKYILFFIIFYIFLKDRKNGGKKVNNLNENLKKKLG